MSFDGDMNVDLESLKRWALSLSVDGITQIDVGGKCLQIDERSKQMLDSQRVLFVNMINRLKEGDNWKYCLTYTGELFQNAFFRVNNSAIRFANYYECLLYPSNIKSYKKLIHGFDYIDVGTINVIDKSGNIMAKIGAKSSLIWSVFYYYFVIEDENGRINHAFDNPEEILSIQLYNVEGMSQERITILINEILLRVSIEHDIDLHIYVMDSTHKLLGENIIRELHFISTGFEEIPMLYLNNAINSSEERLCYLSFYQVMEYFFVRAQNENFLSAFAIIDTNNVNHNELRKVLSEHRNSCTERESLRLVLAKAINVVDFRRWVSSKAEYFQTYCNSDMLSIDIQKSDKKIISALAERVYSYRCSIAHAKGDVEEYIAVPIQSSQIIKNELPLLKFLAFTVIQFWSGK